MVFETIAVAMLRHSGRTPQNRSCLRAEELVQKGDVLPSGDRHVLAIGLRPVQSEQVARVFEELLNFDGLIAEHVPAVAVVARAAR